MNEYLFLLPILIFLLLGVMSPGPSFILVAQTAMTKSRSEAVAVSFGMGIGATVFAIIASIGLFVLLESIPWVYIALKVFGGAYLCFLAYKIWISAREPMSDSSSKNINSKGIIKMFLVGLFTQLSNPKTAIVFGSAFAAFLPKEVPDYSYFLLSFSAFFIDTVWYVLVATLLSTQKAQKTYVKFKKQISWAASGFMGLLGVKLFTSQQLP